MLEVNTGGIVDRALTTRGPVVTSDLLYDDTLEITPLEQAAGARGAVVVPIDGQTQPFGTLGAMSTLPHHFQEEDTAFLSAIANVLADAVERRAAEAEIAEISAARGRLVAQAIDAEDSARRRISEALHDGALQELLAVRNELFAMEGRGGDDAAITASQERLTAIVGRLREVMSALHPTMLQYGGLEAALLAVVEQERAGGDFTAHVTVEEAAAGERDELLLSLARELLANAARHAGATRIEVAVTAQDGAVLLSVADDGVGIAPGAPRGRAGRGRDRDRLVPRAGRGARRQPARHGRTGVRNPRVGADSGRRAGRVRNLLSWRRSQWGMIPRCSTVPGAAP